MRPLFAIWLDDGRADYGVARARLAFAGQFGIGIIVLAVGGMGVRNFYSQLVASSNSDSVANAVPPALIDGDHATTDSFRAKPQGQPQTIGLAPSGATDLPTTAKSQPFAGPAPHFSTTPGEQKAAAEVTPIDRTVADLGREVGGWLVTRNSWLTYLL